MSRHIFAAALGLAILAAGCIRLISAEQLEDGSAVMCVRIEPTDAGADSAPSPEPATRYVPGARMELP